MSAMHMFQQQFKKDNPNCGSTFMSRSAQAWNGLDPEVKEKYKQEYTIAKAAYDTQLEKFHAGEVQETEAAPVSPPKACADEASSSLDDELEL